MFDLRAHLEALHKRFGTAGMAVAVIALVAALGGTALAAGAFSAKQKKEIEKIAKKFAGKPGANGAAGPQGPAGPAGANGAAGGQGAQGATGPQGATGATGKTGATGATGPAGESVVAEPASVGECAEGGTRFSVGVTEEHVCNGAEGATGATGPQGEPGPVTGVAPSGITMTGVWSVLNKNVFGTYINISFPLRLSSAWTTKHLITGEAAHTAGAVSGCPGKVESPAAETGILCIYANGYVNLSTSLENANPSANPADFKYGAIFEAPLLNETEEAFATGTWAVKAP